MSSRKETIENWFRETENNNMLSDIIRSAAGNTIELYITGLSENYHEIKHYKQDDSDLMWFSLSLHGCEDRQEEIDQLRGAIEQEIEDEDFNI